MYLHLHSKIEEEKLSQSEPQMELGAARQCMYTTDLSEINNFLDLQRPRLNAVNCYVSGLIKLILDKKKEAREMFVLALNLCPLFWSAWLELSKISQELESEPFAAVKLISDHWAKNLFILNVFVQNVRISEKIEQLGYVLCCGLVSFFPNWGFLKDAMAMFFHNLSDYDSALEFFFQCLANDPYRLEHMDVLSNILYVKERHNELGKLALRCFEIDKYSPETCCVLGNYYSLIGEHPLAANQFKRAISLDKSFLAGYTLLGKFYIFAKLFLQK